MAGGNILVVFLSYPLYLHYLGVELYGLWSAISIVLVFADLGNLGISNAIIKYTAEEWGRKNKTGITEYISTSFILLFIPSIIIIAFLIFARNWIPTILKLKSDYFTIAKSIIPPMGILSMCVFYTKVLMGSVMALGRVDISNYIFLAGNLIKIALTVFLLMMGFGIWALFYGALINNILLLIIYSLIIKYTFKIKVFSLNGFSIEKLKILVRFGSNMVGSQIFNMFMEPFIKISITRFISLSAVTYFDIAWRSVLHLRSFFERGLNAIMPRISELNSIKNFDSEEDIIDIHNKALKFSVFFGIPSFFFIFLFSDRLLKIWLRNNFNPAISVIFKYLLIAWGISLLFLPSYFLLMGIGKEKYCFHEALIKSGLTFLLIISLSLSGILTLNSTVISVSISIIISHLYIGYKYLRYLNISKLEN